MDFTAVETFYSDELKSEYVAGLSYTVRSGNDLLAKKAAEWLKEGKIVEGRLTADVKGKGHIWP